MARYQPGDVVQVRLDLVVGEEYGSCDEEGMEGYTVVDEMKEFAGRTMTIVSAFPSTVVDCTSYYLLEDTERWRWTDQMFEQEPDPLASVDFSSGFSELLGGECGA